MSPGSPSRKYLLIGLFPFLWMAILQVLGMGALITGNQIQSWVPILSLLLSISICFQGAKQSQIDPKKIFIPISLSVGISLIISYFVFDTTFDGQDYQQEAVLKLLSGWTPLGEKTYFSIHHHYPLGSWISATAIVKLTGAIETGKLFALLFIFGNFYISLFALSFLPSFSFFLKRIIALLIAVNPVSIVQSLSFYLDGMLASCYLNIILLGFVFIMANKEKKSFWWEHIAIGTWIIIGFSLKFTAIPVIGILILGIGGILLVNKKRKRFSHLMMGTLLSVILSAGFISFHPYTTNLIEYSDPFYPFNDPDYRDKIITTQIPKELKQKNRFEKLLISTFSQTEGDIHEPLSWKIPFTFTIKELAFFKRPDVRISGWGPLFSGVLILSFIGLIALWYSQTSNRLTTSLAILVILASILIIPESWNARYIPQYIGIPLLIAIALLLAQKKYLAGIGYTILAFLSINIVLVGINYIPHNYNLTLKNYRLLQEVKSSNQTIEIPIYHRHSESLARRLTEYEIPFKRIKVIGIDSCKSTIWFPGNADAVCLSDS